jgi:hypothetical protein
MYCGLLIGRPAPDQLFLHMGVIDDAWPIRANASGVASVGRNGFPCGQGSDRKVV